MGVDFELFLDFCCRLLYRIIYYLIKNVFWNSDGESYVECRGIVRSSLRDFVYFIVWVCLGDGVWW